MKLEELAGLASPEIEVGIGLTRGDAREHELLARAGFCPLKVYRSVTDILRDLDQGEITAAVRGSLSAKSLLEHLKGRVASRALMRIALLVLPDGHAFLLGPVGIDEGGTLARMRIAADDMREFARLLGWEPHIAVLSYGRPEDSDRTDAIRRSIRRGERLSKSNDVRHLHITVEDAFPWANCLIAPDGMSGNLIYRTLTRLGSGRSLGALYFPLSLGLADTSRSGDLDEYLGAVALANIAARFIES